MSSTYQRLKASERLVRKADFERAYAKGKRLSSRWFIAYVFTTTVEPLRVGVVASRRVGGAIERNRAKRRLRDVFRRNRPSMPVAADVVLIARPTISQASYREIEKTYVGSVGRALEELVRCGR